MRPAKPRYSILLLVCLSVTVLGCQTQDVKDTHSATVAKKEWATLSGRMSRGRNFETFPSKIVFRKMDGHDLGRVVKKRQFDCVGKECKFRPGRHSIEIDYIWSKTETIEQQKKKLRSEGLGVALMIFGAVPDLAVYENSKCGVTIEFEVQAARQYVLNVVHTDKRREPDAFQIVDTESDVVIASQTRCDLIYETALPLSEEPVSSDQCAIHLISDISSPMTFYLNDSHPYYGHHMSHTLFTEPGEQAIKVTRGRVSPSARPKNIESIVVQCDGGEAKYVQINMTMGIWAYKYILIELSAQEAQLANKTILR